MARVHPNNVQIGKKDMKLMLNEQELAERIQLNEERLATGDYYSIEQIFAPKEYDWPGDKEGRALLAFVDHYKMTGRKIPCMEKMLEMMPEKLNERGYLGAVQSDMAIEQQLSGHSWMLRGLCEHYEQFGDEISLQVMKSVTENLFLPTKGIYSTYPVNRENADVGGVSGTELGMHGKWRLSTDVGCAFMSIDGLSHVYALTKDECVKELLDEMIDVYLSIDKIALRVQTHTTLSAARGMMRMYELTQAQKYLDGGKQIYDLYVHQGGMTLTYQNLNWWARPDTWTEPCAIVDSLMLSLMLYKATGEEEYRVTAARVWHNGFATLQRANGGAGTDTIVFPGSPWNYLASSMYEAYFCCTMRLAEGLWYVKENAQLLWAQTQGEPVRNEQGVYMDGDIIYALVSGGAEEYAQGFVEKDGMKLCPLVKYYKLPRDVMEASKQQVVFD